MCPEQWVCAYLHTCIPPASNLQVTDIPQHHHLNKWAGKYFIFTQVPGNSPWLLDLWTESLPLHKSLAPLRLHALKTLYLICWWLLSVRRATEDSIPEPAVAPVGVDREGEKKKKRAWRIYGPGPPLLLWILAGPNKPTAAMSTSDRLVNRCWQTRQSHYLSPLSLAEPSPGPNDPLPADFCSHKRHITVFPLSQKC